MSAEAAKQTDKITPQEFKSIAFRVSLITAFTNPWFREVDIDQRGVRAFERRDEGAESLDNVCSRHTHALF